MISTITQLNNMNLSIERISPSEWQIYKELRLEALKLAPQAFGSK
jgi:hypothetical protein